jgi:hypothetical protein
MFCTTKRSKAKAAGRLFVWGQLIRALPRLTCLRQWQISLQWSGVRSAIAAVAGKQYMSQEKLPPGWHADRVQRLIAHYDALDEDHQVAEDEAAQEQPSQITVVGPESDGLPSGTEQGAITTVETPMAARQPDFLRADYVSDDDMQGLTGADQRLVDYDGRSALLWLDNSTGIPGGKNNVVRLDFINVAGGTRASGDFSDILRRLRFNAS